MSSSIYLCTYMERERFLLDIQPPKHKNLSTWHRTQHEKSETQHKTTIGEYSYHKIQRNERHKRKERTKTSDEEPERKAEEEKEESKKEKGRPRRMKEGEGERERKIERMKEE